MKILLENFNKTLLEYSNSQNNMYDQSRDEAVKMEKDGMKKSVENLKPFTTQQDRSKARENGRAGGIASGEARRWRRDMRAFLRDYLDQDAPLELQSMMALYGVAEESRTNAMALFVGVFVRAMKYGDAKAANCILEWAGMEPLQTKQEEVERLRLEHTGSRVGAVSDGDVDSEEGESDVIIYTPITTNNNNY